MPIDFNELRDFIQAIAKTDISELTIREGDFELTIQKQLPASITSAQTVVPVLPTQVVETPTPMPVEVKPATAPETVTPSSTAKPDNWREITSPMVGTFYRAPAPGEAVFVEIGDKISVGQVVCIIEAMKLMNEIEAEISGQVTEIAVENGEPVEYGQTLFWVAEN